MPIFEYQALDAKGSPVKGTIQGSSLDDVARTLATKGLRLQQIGIATNINDPLAVPAASIASRTAAPPPRSELKEAVFGKVPLTDLAVFFRQLASLLNAGVGPADAFNTLQSQTNSKKLKEVLEKLESNAIAGIPMSVAMAAYPEVFSPLMLGLIQSGEKLGFLDRACQDVSKYIEQEIELRNLIRRETLWPKITLIAGTLIIAIANIIIASIGKESLLTTPLNRWTTWLWLGPLIIAIFLFIRLVLPKPSVRIRWDELLVRLPWIGGAVHRFAMAKFGRTFGAAYRGGILIPECIRMGADACGNEYIRARIYPAIGAVTSGAPVSQALTATGVMGPLVSKMLETGERTGDLDSMLNKVAEYHESEAAMSARQMALVFGLIVFLLLAIYVFFIVLTFFQSYAGAQFKVLEE